METARSWTATIEMVAERWGENRVPSRYAHRSLTESLDALQSTDRALASSDAARDIAAQARARIERAARITQTLLSAMDANDRSAVTGSMALLAVEREGLDSLIREAARQ
jgi:hypothetical protein